MKKVLFLINGLGLGNATRCHAIIEELIEVGCEVHIMTSGNGIWYFEGNKKIKTIEELDSLFYGKKKNKLSIIDTFLSFNSLFKVMKKNSILITNALKKINPEVIVTDSIYSYKPLIKSKKKIIAINNANQIVSAFFEIGKKPLSIYAQFIFIELMDFLYHKFFPYIVLSPWVKNTKLKKNGKIYSIPPIIRKNINLINNNQKKVLLMLSGSNFGTKVFLYNKKFNFKIDVVGRDKPLNIKALKNVKYHGKIKDNRKLIIDTNLAIVNGGFSAVSEMFCLKIPMIVIPVPNHSEQWLNAKTIEDLGVGLVGNEDNYENLMIYMLKNLNQYNMAYNKISINTNGALIAANIIRNAK